MNDKLKRLLKGEGGITGLETAIILIAFVVVAAVFAFTVLSAGIFSSEKGKEAVYSGLAEVSGSLEIKGSVIATAATEGVTGTVASIIFSVANVAGGEAVDFTAPTDNKVVVDYRDENQRVSNLTWSKTAKGKDDADDLLEAGELFEVTVPVTVSTVLNSTGLPVNTTFVLEVKPETGGVLVIERTTPAYINLVMDLH